MTIRFLKFMVPQKETTAVFTLSPEEGGTKLHFSLTYGPKGIGHIMAPLMRKSMQKSAAGLVRDLKAQSEAVAATSPQVAR